MYSTIADHVYTKDYKSILELIPRQGCFDELSCQEFILKNIGWVWPPRNSDPQVVSFSVGDPYKPSFTTVTGSWPHPKYRHSLIQSPWTPQFLERLQKSEKGSVLGTERLASGFNKIMFEHPPPKKKNASLCLLRMSFLLYKSVPIILPSHFGPWKKKFKRLIFPTKLWNPQKFTLPETNSSHLKTDGWNTFSFPFGVFSPIFRGFCC